MLLVIQSICTATIKKTKRFTMFVTSLIRTLSCNCDLEILNTQIHTHTSELSQFIEANTSSYIALMLMLQMSCLLFFARNNFLILNNNNSNHNEPKQCINVSVFSLVFSLDIPNYIILL